MKALFLNSTDCRGGAARATMRLLKAMQSVGVDVELLAQEYGDKIAQHGVWNRCRLWLKPRLDSLPVLRYPNRTGMIFSPSRLPDGISEIVRRKQPDLIHLHWIQEGFVKIETLAVLKAPIVWTLHDSWPFTGGCHLPYKCCRFADRCGACPVLGSDDEDDLSKKIWTRKKKAWKNVPMTLVAPSKWLAEKARASSLFCDQRIEVIPNCFDSSVFRADNREPARKKLGIEPDKPVLFVNASQMSVDHNKGGDLLGLVLAKLATHANSSGIHLLLVGGNFPANLIPDTMSVTYTGQIRNEHLMAEFYAASDLLILVSRLENLSNTVMEAMACAVPSVAFNTGGMSDLIDDGVNGRLVEPFDTDGFADSAWWCLNPDRLPELRCRAEQIAAARYAAPVVASTYYNLYCELLGCRNKDS